MTPPTHTLGAFLQEKFTNECVERSVTPPPPDQLASICDSVAHSLHHAAVGKHAALKELVDAANSPDGPAWPAAGK